MVYISQKLLRRIFKFSEILCRVGFLLILAFSSNAQNQNCFLELNVLPEKTYYIQSPNYPKNYTEYNQCTWNIKSSFPIHINCEIDIPPSNNCELDQLLVYLNPNKGPLNLCGDGTFSRDSVGHEMKITLRSNNSTPGGRFLCYLQIIDTQENCRCGWKKPTRIVGGENSGVNEYPMMAGIVDPLYKQVYCGGSIISNKHVLTAAHCLRNRKTAELAVLIGDHDLSKGSEAKSSLLLVSKYILHPSFSLTKRNSDFDIAIITVSTIIQFTNEVGPACLPFQHNHDSFSGSFVEILGWGTTELAGPIENILQKAQVSVINLSKCIRNYPAITDHQLCTLTVGKDACQFDSGGPVLWENPTTGRLVSVGIISYGVACGINVPSVNTRVGAFVDWIVSQTQGI